MIKKYRSKMTIEAIKFTGNNVNEIETFIKNRPYDDTKTSEYKNEIRIQDSSGIGTFIAHIGDYVIKANNGTICMCTGDIFEKEFEEVKSSEDTENKQDEQVVEEDKDNHDYKEAKGENKQMELKDTITMMQSADYKERFKAEYYQVKIRYEKLKNMIEKWDKGELTFIPTCPRETYDFQLKSMKEYLSILIIRAKIENIYLGE